MFFISWPGNHLELTDIICLPLCGGHLEDPLLQMCGTRAGPVRLCLGEESTTLASRLIASHPGTAAGGSTWTSSYPNATPLSCGTSVVSGLGSAKRWPCWQPITSSGWRGVALITDLCELLWLGVVLSVGQQPFVSAGVLCVGQQPFVSAGVVRAGECPLTCIIIITFYRILYHNSRLLLT